MDSEMTQRRAGNLIVTHLKQLEREIISHIQKSNITALVESGILDPGIKPNFSITPNGITPFLLACSVGHVPLMRVMLENPQIQRD